MNQETLKKANELQKAINEATADRNRINQATQISFKSDNCNPITVNIPKGSSYGEMLKNSDRSAAAIALATCKVHVLAAIDAQIAELEKELAAL